MRILVAEDDFVSRRLLMEYLSPYGSCDPAVDGKEALEAFKKALEIGKPYDLICLDIMMPEIDGQEVLHEIRRFEEEKGIAGLFGVKIIMTTALDDFKNIMTAFRHQCEAYLVKPVERGKMVEQLKSMGLLKE
ncbi:MAG: response regulator [Candidatus Ozemobacteraceae bacterium]